MNPRPADEPVLVFHTDPHRTGSDSVSVSEIDVETIALLETDFPADQLLRVAVIQSGSSSCETLPNVSGRYRISEKALHFVPHFPFERGVRYQAIFKHRAESPHDSPGVLQLEFQLPERQIAGAAEVTKIYPTADCLPENLLRFCVCFSAPMARGGAAGAIVVLGPDGSEATDVLYRAPVELWDRAMKHLTVLLDPGRLKRGVGPNVELGPPLREGETYTLVVGSGISDASGRPLRSDFRKQFRVTTAVREPIETERWEVIAPQAGGRRPLVLTFSRPLDWTLLQLAIEVVSHDGNALDGTAEIDRCETRWQFVPKLPWRVGDYGIRVRPWLEDVCGNSTIAAFDRIFQPGGGSLNGGTEQVIAFKVGNQGSREEHRF